MIRILCKESDACHMVNTGGPLQEQGKTFDIDAPELEEWLAEPGANKWIHRVRSVVAVEVLPSDSPKQENSP